MSTRLDNIAALAQECRNRLSSMSSVYEHAPLGRRTTYRVGGAAALLVEIGSVEDLMSMAQLCATAEVPVSTLGNGSNTLVADRGWRGAIIVLGAFADVIEIPEGVGRGEHTLVHVGAAASLPMIARRCAAQGVGGLEWLVGIPGTIGGALRMNAGGHGSDMNEALEGAVVVDLARGVAESWEPGEFAFDFRSSTLTDEHVVIEAQLRAVGDDPDAIGARLEGIVRWRRDNQPGGQNCGSVFVNPVPHEVSAGALIDQLGLRGLRLGSAEVSTKHANFIQADPAGSADDVKSLIDEVRRRVERETGYHLRSEVRLLGFEDD